MSAPSRICERLRDLGGLAGGPGGGAGRGIRARRRPRRKRPGGRSHPAAICPAPARAGRTGDGRCGVGRDHSPGDRPGARRSACQIPFREGHPERASLQPPKSLGARDPSVPTCAWPRRAPAAPARRPLHRLSSNTEQRYRRLRKGQSADTPPTFAFARAAALTYSERATRRRTEGTTWPRPSGASASIR